jgi:hypothetical protein
MRRLATPDFAARLADAVLKEADARKDRLEALQGMLFDRFVTAAQAAAMRWT